ncbi:hypothetical protein [Paracoccus sphaerophysae]|uniref:Uncharacterized protein n=1 Tax=Paracoccus sphaerophysae TaxID=690417 RepID=A0A099EZ45_9RHOB|nr:hypothetical protein [Paracoccus sphaerophysae]KGJ03256.1 hypothetical protein IC63_13575 [Paracoccus sphaerophysae]
MGDLLARAPIPNDAVGYVDFLTGLHMTQAAESVATNASLVFGPISSVAPGYYYGKNDIAFMTNKLWERIEYTADGECLGLLVDGDWTQRLNTEHRINLTAGAMTGASVAAVGAAAQPYQQWYAVTPSGSGEASLTLATSSVSAGSYAYIAVDVRGSGIVQLGARNAAADAYVNVNLLTGEVVTGAGAVGQAMRRRDGWTVFACVAIAVAGDVQPYMASVAALTTAKLGAAGLAFAARAPRVAAYGSATMPAPGLWPHTASSGKADDNLTQVTTMVADAADFTCVFRARSGWTKTRRSAGLFLWSNSGNSGTELRFGADNTLFLIDRNSGTPRWSFATRWKPETIYRVGVSRIGGVLSACVNGEVATVDTGTVAADATPRLLRGFDTSANMWSGHLQKAIWWAEGRRQADLAALVEQWL